MKKILITMMISVSSIIILNACSTIEGAGKDLQGAGQVISNEAKKTKKGY